MRTTTKRFNEKNGKALIVGRVILDFGLDMKAHRKKEDKWKAHKDWVAKEFLGNRKAYFDRLSKIIERAKDEGVELLVFPACAMIRHNTSHARRYRTLFRGISCVAGGVLSVTTRRGMQRYRESAGIWIEGRQALKLNSDAARGVSLPRVHILAAISSTIGQVADPKMGHLEALTGLADSKRVLVMDMGHHQYSGRYLRTLRRVWMRVRDASHKRTVVVLAFWKYLGTKSETRWMEPKKGRRQKFERHRIPLSIDRSREDFLDVIRF